MVIDHFKSRFNDFFQIKTLIKIVSVPLSVDVSEVSIEILLEIIELWNNILIYQFVQGENLYKILSKCTDFSLLQNFQKILVLLEVYIYLKNMFLSYLTDSNLECSLRLKTSHYEMDFNKLMQNLSD